MTLTLYQFECLDSYKMPTSMQHSDIPHNVSVRNYTSSKSVKNSTIIYVSEYIKFIYNTTQIPGIAIRYQVYKSRI